MEFGLIKSKIEKLLSESYVNGNLKYDMFIFNELVLKDKDVSRLFSLYSDLAENRGYDNDFATEFIKESIVEIKKIKPSNNSINEINMWLSTTNVNNEYVDIDNLVSEKMVSIEDKIKSKNNIFESLKTTPKTTKSLKKVSLDSIVGIANKTISEHLNKMDEKTKKDLNEVLYESNDRLKIKFDILKESITDKLSSLKEVESDNEVITQIDETLVKVSSEEFDKLNYVKLKELYRNL
jgi:hypothetical protein